VKVTFNLAPVVASRPRVTRWSTFFPKKYAQFKEDMLELTKDITYTPSKELIYVQMTFYVAMPKSWSKKKKLEKGGQFCDNNCDIDNYCKATLDSLEGVYFENDKQVAMIRAMKYYAHNPRIEYQQTEIVNE
jgi:Holliday junction resolvase RusA-like endonuclease